MHGGTKIARGAEGIRATMAAYIELEPHMDVVTHHTTVAGDFAMTRSQWRITGRDEDGKPVEVHHHAWRCIARERTAPGISSSTIRSGRTRAGRFRVRPRRSEEGSHRPAPRQAARS